MNPATIELWRWECHDTTSPWRNKKSPWRRVPHAMTEHDAAGWSQRNGMDVRKVPGSLEVRHDATGQQLGQLGAAQPGAGMEQMRAIADLTGEDPSRRSAMADDTTNRGAADRNRINVSEPYELRYWTQALNVTETVLRDAVKAVGPMADKVREHLKKK